MRMRGSVVTRWAGSLLVALVLALPTTAAGAPSASPPEAKARAPASAPEAKARAPASSPEAKARASASSPEAKARAPASASPTRRPRPATAPPVRLALAPGKERTNDNKNRDKGAARHQRSPLSLETDPPPLPQVAPNRAVFQWPASPRLRTGVWIAVHFFKAPEQTYRRYDPELVYRKQDKHFMGQLGGALRLGPVELSLAAPFVGLLISDFYEKGVVDREVRKTDRADLRLGLKYGFRIRDDRDLWLITPYVAVTAPSGKHRKYEVSLGGHPVTHYTSPGESVVLLPGVAAGWRRGWWSVSVSVGPRVSLPVERDEDPGDDPTPRDIEIDWVGAYQFGFSPFRDLGFTVAVLHSRRLTEPAEQQRDLFWFATGLRLHPYLGLYGHIGIAVPVGPPAQRDQPLMVTLQTGWEF